MNTKIFIIALMASCLVFAGLFTDCKNKHQQPSPQTLNLPEHHLRVGMIGVLRPPQPLLKTSGNTSLINQLTYQSLLARNREGELRPQLATKIKMLPGSENKQQWRIRLRQGVTWHDGRPLRAQDVVASFTCAKQTSLNSWAGPLLHSVKKIYALNESWVVFEVEGNSPLLKSALALWIVPADQTPCRKGTNQILTPLGTGPFRPVQWSNRFVLLERYDGYWGTRPAIQKISFEVVEDKKVGWTRMIRSELDLFYEFANEAKRITESQPHLRLVSYPQNFFHMVLFNTHRKHLKDARVRQALNFAVDKEAIIQRVLKGDGVPSAGVLRPSDPSQTDLLKPYPYDPQRALQLLSQSGYHYDRTTNRLIKNGKQMQLQALAFHGDQESKQIMLEVQAFLQDIGIHTRFQTVEIDQAIDRVQKDKDDLIHMYSRASPNPVNLYRYFSGRPHAEFPYQSKILTALFDQHLLQGKLSRVDFLKKFNRQIYEEPPGIFLFWKNLYVTLNKRVTKTDLNGENFWGDIVHWSVEKTPTLYQVGMR